MVRLSRLRGRATERSSIHNARSKRLPLLPPPAMETLEPRQLLSAYVVSDTSDSASDNGSLRYAVAQADAASTASTITFSGAAFPMGKLTTITLGSPLELSNASAKILIAGPGSTRVQINGGAVAANGQVSGGSTIFLVDADANAEIDDLTLAGGDSLNNPTPFSSLNEDGGAVYNRGTLLLGNDTLTNNLAAHGGAILNTGTLDLVNSAVSTNVGAADGGGMFATSGSRSTLVSDTFTANASPTGAGGIDAVAGSLSITTSTFTQNSGGSAGAIEIQSAALTIAGSTFTNNAANSSMSSTLDGGGVFDDQGSSAQLTRDTFAGNSATDGGGIYSSGPMTLLACTLADNDASSQGAAIDVQNAMTIVNSTLVGNVAALAGGAIYNAGSVTLTDCTVAANDAPLGGGIDNQGTTALADGTIIAGDITSSADSTPSDWDGAAADSGSSHNLLGAAGTSELTNGVAGNLVGTLGAPINPLLAPLEDNGGTTQTAALLPGSPAIAAGATFNDANGSPIVADQRGLSLLAGATPDIGAYQTSASAAIALHLVFTQQPANALTNAAIAPPVTVSVENAAGQIVTTDSSNVTLALSGGTLAGTTTVAAVNGVATFSAVSVAAAGSYTLTATDGSDASASSSQFTVTAPVVYNGLLRPTISKNTLPANIVTGKTLPSTVTVALTNLASTTVSGRAAIRIYATASGVIDGASVLVASLPKRLILRAGKSISVRLRIKSLPTSLANGAYTLLAQAIDPAGNAQNSASGPVANVAAAFVALAVANVTLVPTSVAAGRLGVVAMTLTNSGNVDAVGLTTFNIGLSTNGLQQTASFGTLKRVLRIRAGQTLAYRIRFIVPATQTAGSSPIYLSVTQNGTTILPAIQTILTIT